MLIFLLLQLTVFCARNSRWTPQGNQLFSLLFIEKFHLQEKLLKSNVYFLYFFICWRKFQLMIFYWEAEKLQIFQLHLYFCANCRIHGTSWAYKVENMFEINGRKNNRKFIWVWMKKVGELWNNWKLWSKRNRFESLKLICLRLLSFFLLHKKSERSKRNIDWFYKIFFQDRCSI
jgi:hypothetical protein